MKTLLFILLFVPITLQCQTEDYFPTQLGTTWVYKIYPDYSKEKERLTISKVTISAIDSSKLVFLNNAVQPQYRVDTLGNVFENPLGTGSNSNQLIFKQKANKLEAWAASESSKTVYRIKDIGLDFVLGRWVKAKIVEWGTTVAPDTFGFSRRSDYYADQFGWYFAIVEPSATERILVGFISGKDTLGDVTKVPNQQNELQNYALHQNYPNPFNPATKIEFEIPKASFVSIKIFDVLGREVAVIVSEELQPGKYSKVWNAENCSSGIYFYSMQSGVFSRTKKLILNK